MCCAFLILVFLGPRFFGAIWWLARPGLWQAAFNNFFGGGAWWLWAALGLVFIPWTSIMFVILVSSPPGVIQGWDWLWLGLGLMADIAWYAGGARRKDLQYQGMSATM